MTWLLVLLSLYAAYCVLLFFVQTTLIFPASLAGEAGAFLPTRDTQRIELPTEQGTTVAWYSPAPAASSEMPAPLAVFFHGNAELMDHQQPIVQLYHQLGVSVFMVEYRGYGHSTGTPSQAHIVADTMAMLGDLLKRSEIDASRLIMHGRSIGGGLATQVGAELNQASSDQPAALIVENTFASLSSMALRYGVPSLLVRSPLDSESAFAELDLPILIMHGRRDTIVPPKHAYRLHAASDTSTLILFDADHNTLPTSAEVDRYVQSIEDHLVAAGVINRPADQRR